MRKSRRLNWGEKVTLENTPSVLLVFGKVVHMDSIMYRQLPILTLEKGESSFNIEIRILRGRFEIGMNG